MKTFVLALGIALMTVTASPVAAAPEDVANRVSEQVMSPFCPGVTLHDCPSPQADALRERIRRWAAGGLGEERIMDRLVAEYGEEVRAVPPADGGGIAAWVMPALVALVGLTTAGTLARRWTKAREREREQEDAEARRRWRELTPGQRERLDAELALQEARMLGTSDTGRLQT
ncbi:MAG: cytochrome c-type biogenesis protein CcmH [Actinomycetota bacterium]